MYDTNDHRRSTARAASTVLLTCVAALALSSASDATTSRATTSRHLQGRAAHTQSVTDTAHLRYLRESGPDLLEEGQATGGLPGRVQVRFNVGATVTASFTISTHDGSISGHGSGTLHGTGVYASFGGSMTVTQGTGRYAHAHGTGGFYGSINRRNYAATVQTTGTLTF
jgi:hypothetical protein